MFFIIGISKGDKKLMFDQMEVCKCCGKYGHLEVYMTYTYFTLFFITLLKWNKQYYVKMSCCHSCCEISRELGERIEHGEVNSIDMEDLKFMRNINSLKQCPSCGYTTAEDYQFCPKCGKQL